MRDAIKTADKMKIFTQTMKYVEGKDPRIKKVLNVFPVRPGSRFLQEVIVDNPYLKNTKSKK